MVDLPSVGDMVVRRGSWHGPSGPQMAGARPLNEATWMSFSRTHGTYSLARCRCCGSRPCPARADLRVSLPCEGAGSAHGDGADLACLLNGFHQCPGSLEVLARLREERGCKSDMCRPWPGSPAGLPGGGTASIGQAVELHLAQTLVHGGGNVGDALGDLVGEEERLVRHAGLP